MHRWLDDLVSTADLTPVRLVARGWRDDLKHWPEAMQARHAALAAEIRRAGWTAAGAAELLAFQRMAGDRPSSTTTIKMKLFEATLPGRRPADAQAP